MKHPVLALATLATLTTLTTLWLATPVLAQAPPGMDRELFERAFGKRTQQPAELALLDLPVWIDGRERGQVAARIKDGELRLRRGDVVRILTGRLKSAVLAGLDTHQDNELTLTDLSTTGLEARYASDRLALELRIPIALHHPHSLSLSTPARLFTEGVIQPAPVSALLNWRLGVARYETPAGFSQEARRLGLEAALNLQGWVFESRAHYLDQNNATRGWRRDDSRLVHDWPDNALRLVAGDLTPPGSKLRAPRPVFGLSLERRFSLNPRLPYQVSPQEVLTLAEGGQADIYINQRQVSSLRLDPGIYTLRDFPVASGANDVQVRVVEPGGRERLVRMSYFFEPTLLTPGMHEFSYALGAPLAFDLDGRRHYRNDQRLLQVGHRLGLNDTLTAGVGLQADRHARLFTVDAVRASAWGNTSIELGHSISDLAAPAWALRLQHRVESAGLLQSGAREEALIIAWETTQNGFTVPGNAGSAVDTREIALRYSRALSDNASATLAVSERRSSAYVEAARSIAATLYKRINPVLSGNLSLSRSTGGLTDSSTALIAMLSWGGAGSPWYGSSQIEAGTGRQIHDINVETSGDGSLLRGGLTVQHSPTFDADSERLQWRTPRFELLARTTRQTAAGARSRNTDIDFASALVWADGRSGVGAPVQDSFALIAPHPRLGERRIFVDPGGASTTAARSDWLGAPVVSTLPSYYPRELSLEVENLPPSWDLGNERPVLMPTYRSGLVVPLGTAGTTSLTGELVRNAAGAPHALARGILRRVDGTGVALQWFTNRAGRFRIDGVAPGRYALELTPEQHTLTLITVPEDGSGFVDLGRLNLDQTGG